MAVVRELVTVLRFQNDRTGIEEYSNALSGLRKLALEAFAFIGSIEAVRKVMELADEWNTVAARVGIVTENVKEQQQVLDTLQKQVEETGASYEGMGNLFVQIAQNKDQIGYTNAQILELTDSISKLLAISGGTRASQQRAIIQIDQMLALGKVTRENLRTLVQDSPGFVQFLAQQFGGRKHFDELVHAGSITAKQLVDVLSAGRDEINRRYAQMPTTFERAFGEIRNMWGRLIKDIGDDSGVWEMFADGAVAASRAVITAIRKVSDAVGGFNNVLKILGILLLARFGPGGLVLAIQGISALAVAIRDLGIAALVSANPVWIIGLAVAAAALAADDLYHWIRGLPSIMGDVIGPATQFSSVWAQVEEAIKELKASWQRLLDDFRQTPDNKWSAALLKALDDLLNKIPVVSDAWREAIEWFSDPRKSIGGTISEIEALIRTLNGLLTVLNQLLHLDFSSAFNTLSQGVHKMLDATPLGKLREEIGSFLNKGDVQAPKIAPPRQGPGIGPEELPAQPQKQGTLTRTGPKYASLFSGLGADYGPPGPLVSPWRGMGTPRTAANDAGGSASIVQHNDNKINIYAPAAEASDIAGSVRGALDQATDASARRLGRAVPRADVGAGY